MFADGVRVCCETRKHTVVGGGQSVLSVEVTVFWDVIP
jgi:hypothetical protein